MNKNVIRDKNNEVVGVMLYLSKDECDMFMDFELEDILFYEEDCKSFEQARIDRANGDFISGEEFFAEYGRTLKDTKSKPENSNDTFVDNIAIENVETRESIEKQKKLVEAL